MKERPTPAGSFVLAVAALAFLVPCLASAGGDMFLKIGNLEGSATAKGHEGWIEVEAFSWGDKQLQSFTSTGQGIARRVTHEPSASSLTLTKVVDAASSALQRSSAASERFGEVTVSFYQTGSDPPAYAIVTLKDAMVTSVRPSSMSAGKERLEDVTLSFRGAKITYKAIDDGE